MQSSSLIRIPLIYTESVHKYKYIDKKAPLTKQKIIGDTLTI